LAPILAPFLIVVFTKFSGYILDLGNKSVKVTLGPINALSSIVIPSQTYTWFYGYIISITASFSQKYDELILQLDPIRAQRKNNN
jgi:hypothetical protein